MAVVSSTYIPIYPWHYQVQPSRVVGSATNLHSVPGQGSLSRLSERETVTRLKETRASSEGWRRKVRIDWEAYKTLLTNGPPIYLMESLPRYRFCMGGIALVKGEDGKRRSYERHFDIFFRRKWPSQDFFLNGYSFT